MVAAGERAAVERVEFPGASGELLAGLLHHPDGEPRGGVALVHCFTCAKDFHPLPRLAKGLAGAGYAVLRFDLTGLGDSKGGFAEKTLTRDIGDVAQAAAALAARGVPPRALVGHSFGAAAALLAAPHIAELQAVATLGAPSSTERLRRLSAGRERELDAAGRIEVEIEGRVFPITQAFLDDLDGSDLTAQVAELGLPLLVVHALGDEVVEIAEGERLFAAARQPKSFVPLLRADHLCSDRAEAAVLAAAVGDWLQRTAA